MPLRDALEIGPAQERLSNHDDLRLDILVRGNARKQRPQRCACIDVDACLRLVHVRQVVHNQPADYADDPGHGERDPAEAPGAAQFVHDLFKDILHT